MTNILRTVGFYLRIGGLLGSSMWTYLRIVVVLMLPEAMRTVISRDLPTLRTRRYENG